MREFGWYNRNTALNPFTMEGKKTAALEIAASMAPEEPDVVVVPTGDGVILAGLAKGFGDLLRAGLLKKRPRLLSVQPEGSAAIVQAWREGSDEIERRDRRCERSRQPHRPGAAECPPLPAANP